MNALQPLRHRQFLPVPSKSHEEAVSSFEIMQVGEIVCQTLPTSKVVKMIEQERCRIEGRAETGMYDYISWPKQRYITSFPTKHLQHY
jgi:hypothetical protein